MKDTEKDDPRSWEALHSEFGRSEWAEAYQNTRAYPDGFALHHAGHVPMELEGTYLRNGPGMFSHGDESFAHPFDGHGLIAAITFSNGKAHFRSRFVETKEYRDETARDQILYPGTFGTKPSGGVFRNFLGSLSPRNPANTGLTSWAGRTLALFEAGQPYQLDNRSLETKGVDLLGGKIQRGAPFSSGSKWVDQIASFFLRLLGVGRNMEGGFRLGGHAVSAHPVEDPVSKSLIMFSFRLQIGFPAFHFFLFGIFCTIWLPSLITKLWIHEFDEDFQHKSSIEQTLPGYAFLHDMSVTAQKYIIFCNPVRLKMLPLILGISSPAHCIQWTQEPAKIHIVDRPMSGNLEPEQDESHAVSLATTDLQCSVHRKSSLFNRKDSAREILLKQSLLKGDVSTRAEQTRRGIQNGTAISVTCASPSFVFHQAGAHLEDNMNLVVDCIRYPTMPDFKQANGDQNSFVDSVDPELQPISQLCRYTVNTQTGSASERILCKRAMEFPTINPNFTGRKHKYIWTAAALHPTANRPQQAICKLDVETGNTIFWTRGLQYYAGEPIFVPTPNGTAEDNGWILCIGYDASKKTSECVILAASDLCLLASLDLQHILPHGLHGVWAPKSS